MQKTAMSLHKGLNSGYMFLEFYMSVKFMQPSNLKAQLSGNCRDSPWFPGIPMQNYGFHTKPPNQPT